MNTCSIDGCDSPERKRSGLCGKHYQRKVRKRCSISGCESFRKRLGFCDRHYNQRFPKTAKPKEIIATRGELIHVSSLIQNDPEVANDFWEFVRKELAL